MLNVDRYDLIRKSIMRHEIPSLIARAAFVPIERTESNDFMFDSEDDEDYSSDEDLDFDLENPIPAAMGVIDLGDDGDLIDEEESDEDQWEDEVSQD
jgi:hypothetical protein